METSAMPSKKAYKGLGMEGMVATWYAKNTAKLDADFKDCARGIADALAPGATVLEVAPGPGYLAVELAKLGAYRITGLDISRSFVRMASENAARAGVDVEFRLGDAAALPFPEQTFDFVVCRAAFKNFSDPVTALREMHRVLRPGGKALIIDMRHDASDEAIDEAVDKMQLGRVDAFITRATFRLMLRKRAYSREDFDRMVALTPFGPAEIKEAPLGFELWLRR
jgi:ubiquinone/menaquinone biosynthesis C-methylase UbiE